jgi:hypothetical protein
MLHILQIDEPIVICGFGAHGQMLAALLDAPLESLPDVAAHQYIAFDLDPGRVQVCGRMGLASHTYTHTHTNCFDLTKAHFAIN